MSNHLISEVYKRQVGNIARKAVMVLMADKASDDGTGIWASKQRMADEIGATKQTVIVTIKALTADGLIREAGQRRCANGFTVQYAINVRALRSLPLVKSHADDQSEDLTGQNPLPVKETDLTSQIPLPDRSEDLTQTLQNPTEPPKEPKGSKARVAEFPCPDGVDPVDWAGLVANRKSKRAPLTEAAHRGIVRKLDAWAGEGWPPGPIVANAAERGWTTVFETDEMKAPRNDRSPNPRSNHSGSARPRNGIDAALDRRLGLDDSPGPLGRRDTGAGSGHSGSTLALPSPSGRPQF